MINVREAVYAALTRALDGVPVSTPYPAAEASYPAVSYYESINLPHAHTDGDEYLTEITYIVDIWSQSVKDNDRIADLANTAMTGMGFYREYMADVPDAECRHTTMRFAAIIAQSGETYKA